MGSPDLLDGFFSLGQDINKVENPEKLETMEGPLTPSLPELQTDTNDADLLKSAKTWEDRWKDFDSGLQKRRKASDEYWLGKAFNNNIDDMVKNDPMADNTLWEALETFIPFSSARNPDPVVTTDNTPDGIDLADKVAQFLRFQADRQSLKISLSRLTRYWAMYFLGVVQVGWSEQSDDIKTVVKRPQVMILDPDATIDEKGEYTGGYLGIHRKETAGDMKRMFKSMAKEIDTESKDNDATEIGFIEWWTPDMTFSTLKKKVLSKGRNPHWNYDIPPDPNIPGVSPKALRRGLNHFQQRKMPFIFLSVFNLGKHPVDDTNMFEQAIPNQKNINELNKQIRKNAQNTNNGLAVSGDVFTKEQAYSVAGAVRKGNTIWVPSGDVNKAIARLAAPELAPMVYQTLLDYRNELKGIFGTKVLSGGQAAQGDSKTQKGQAAARSQELDRIGGGVTAFIEQAADNIYNWWVQLFYVYYSEDHTASIIGKENAVEYVELKKSDLNRRIRVTIKEGSMIPQDPMSRRNEAVELFSAGALDPITLFERLDYPNPREAAKNLYLWKSNPASLFPELNQPQKPDDSGQVSPAGGPAAPPAPPGVPGAPPGSPAGLPPPQQAPAPPAGPMPALGASNNPLA
jgi:hypothetical protein